ncbi:hypothetical protein TNCV_1206611 [Trichonephila clavipes]|nr:hypothetical protein TNCV_1206611 [Trichonephila clavipes]
MGISPTHHDKLLSQDIWVAIGKVVCCNPQLVQSIAEEDVHRKNLSPPAGIEPATLRLRSEQATSQPPSRSPSFLSGTTAQGEPWPSQEAFSRPAFFLLVFSSY